MRSLGELEAAIMDVLWRQDTPATVREVLTVLSWERQLAYTTVMTVMENLHRKGFLRREPDGRAFRYEPVQQRAEYAASMMREAMRTGQDDNRTFTHFIALMTPDESDALRGAMRRRSRRRPA